MNKDKNMENQRKVIEILFRRIPLKYVVQGLASAGRFDNKALWCTFEKIPEKIFHDASYHVYREISDDEVRNIYCKTMEEMRSEDNNTKSVFHLLFRYGEKVLTTDDKFPVCRYEHLLNWWKCSNKIGQDLVTMAYLAYRDIGNHERTTYFSYPMVINHDNHRLNYILDKGLAENHFHLNGSSATFALSWIYLMNHFGFINKKTSVFNDLLDKDIYGMEENFKWGKYIRIAAIIRASLFSKIIGEKWECKAFIKNEMDDLPFGNIYVSDFIQTLRYQYGRRMGKDSQPFDYAVHCGLSEDNFNENRALVGERFFLYECFRRIYSNDFTFEEQQMLYIYLRVKISFRGEMIQSNDRTGFHNFLRYQDRKDIIFDDDRIYEKEADILAVNASCRTQNIKFFEVRVAAKDSADRFIASIEKKDSHVFGYEKFVTSVEKEDCYVFGCEKKIQENNSLISNKNYFYVIHFIKEREESDSANDVVQTNIRCRNYNKRREVHKEAVALYKALEKNKRLRKRIKGIDRHHLK